MIRLSILFASFIIFLTFSYLRPLKRARRAPAKLLLCLSLIRATGLIIWLIIGCPQTLIRINWFYSSLKTFSVSFFLDTSFIIFSCVGLLVTWSIIEFSLYYMRSDPKIQNFINRLILFLFFMMVLTSSNNLFALFIGWEGVGILSFILIGWWFTRADTQRASIQAIIYNRIGDVGFIFFIIIKVLFTKTWELSKIIFMRPYLNTAQWAIAGVIVAAVGKSAQFGLHPWLPSAMEGPTPVSALLHRSTMVVAGVFLLYRCSPLLTSFPWIKIIIGLIGSLTALFASSVALYQFDLKKVIAYSTTSQLGLMVVAISLGFPRLAFFHICTHAFFKSLLFLCSGRVIHNLKKEQDFRKIKRLPLPFTTRCIIVGNIALCGFPFLAGFYSKDLILEACQYKKIKFLIITLSLLATLITTLYRLRIIFYLLNTKINLNPTTPIKEKTKHLYKPLLRLIGGAIARGWIFSYIKFDFEPYIIPLLKKRLPLIFTIYSFVLVFEKLNSPQINPISSIITNYLSKNWFYVTITHGERLKNLYNISLEGVLRTLDQGWITRVRVRKIIKKTKIYTNWAQLTQRGKLIQYFIKALLLLTGAILLTT
jgi:NADH:ubiquinone oxidoreductase subunit 5 (chain L)/Multisubunit Na+/H+ antiporter, MnhA subunit